MCPRAHNRYGCCGCSKATDTYGRIAVSAMCTHLSWKTFGGMISDVALGRIQRNMQALEGILRSFGGLCGRRLFREGLHADDADRAWISRLRLAAVASQQLSPPQRTGPAHQNGHLTERNWVQPCPRRRIPVGSSQMKAVASSNHRQLAPSTPCTRCLQHPMQNVVLEASKDRMMQFWRGTFFDNAEALKCQRDSGVVDHRSWRCRTEYEFCPNRELIRRASRVYGHEHFLLARGIAQTGRGHRREGCRFLMSAVWSFPCC